MKPGKFDYRAPRRPEEVLQLLSAHGEDAKVLAGGQSLMPLLNMRLSRPKVLIDLGRVSGLNYVRIENEEIAIGAMATEACVEESGIVREGCPLLADAVRLVGHPAIRNRGTVGGSAAHGDYRAEIPAVLMTLDGRIRVQGERGGKEIAAKEFFLGYFSTCLDPDEIITELRFPVMSRKAGWAIEELTRRHGDFAVVGASAYVEMNRERIREARLVLFGVGEIPVRIQTAEALLKEKQPQADLFDAVGEAARTAIDPPSDVHASSAYRRHVAAVLMLRALRRAAERAHAEDRNGV